MKIEPLYLHWKMQKYAKKEPNLWELLEKCNFKYVPPNLHGLQASWGSNGTIWYKFKDIWAQNWES